MCLASLADFDRRGSEEMTVVLSEGNKMLLDGAEAVVSPRAKFAKYAGAIAEQVVDTPGLEAQRWRRQWAEWLAG